MEISVVLICLIAILGYICGAIPTAAWIADNKGIDITQRGSGNSGATNIGRLLGLKYFFAVFFIDSLKAFCFLWLLRWFKLPPVYEIIGAITLLCGNGYSLFLKGRGGKGISTAVGILSALLPQLVPILFPLWMIIFMLLRTVGIASVTTVCALPILASMYVGNKELIFLSIFITVWCLVKHAANLKQFFNLEVT